MDTKELLKQISALRQRLDTRESAGASAASLPRRNVTANDPIQALQRNVETGSWETMLLNESMRQLPGMAMIDSECLPSQLTSRSIRLLKHGRELLREMREMTEDSSPLSRMGAADDQDPLCLLHRDALAVTDVVVRTIQAFPSAPSAQMRLCEGLEGILGMIDEKLSILKSGLAHRRKEQKWIEYLADVLTNILNGSSAGLTSLKPLAQEVVSEAHQGQALRFLDSAAAEPACFVAAHSLNVAQVLGRILQHDDAWQIQAEEPLLTAFIHDIGMVLVPIEILNRNGPLADEQRRIVEKHAALGAEVATRLWSQDSPQVQAIAEHHERIDGTGYPQGRREQHLTTFSRLFAACDVYAALCGQRPYRPALDTRAAMTETLMLADQRLLDRNQVERLLALSYHPVGSVVELSDGSYAAVVAVHATGCAKPAEPVLLLLSDSQGLPLPIPRQLDLAQDEQRSIVRNLPALERRRVLLKRYPELV